MSGESSREFLQSRGSFGLQGGKRFLDPVIGMSRHSLYKGTRRREKPPRGLYREEKRNAQGKMFP